MTPPEGVRLCLADGTEIPLEVVYEGFRDGTHAWAAVVELGSVHTDALFAGRAALRIDMIPPHTSVRVRLARP